MSNYMPSKVWDEITYPFPNFNGCTVEVWEWVSNFMSHFIMDAITYRFHLWEPDFQMRVDCATIKYYQAQWVNALAIFEFSSGLLFFQRFSFSCNETCQIWSWFKISRKFLWRELSLMKKLMSRALVTKLWGPFQEGFFHHNSNSIENCF